MIKRQSEENCPTDIRQTVPWCAGEDAIFHCPCGPDGSFYGYKPTCWNVWPAAGAEWRDAQCGPQMTVSDGEPRGYHPTEPPTRVPGHVEEMRRGTPPARDFRPAQDTDGIVPELPFPDASSSGQWPPERTSGPLRNKEREEPQYQYERVTERTSGPLWPNAVARAQYLAPTSQPTRVTLPRPREEQLPRPPLDDDVDDTNGDALLPSAVPAIVFQSQQEGREHVRLLSGGGERDNGCRNGESLVPSAVRSIVFQPQ